MASHSDNSLGSIKEKIKNFFRKMSNDRDSSVNVNPPKRGSVDNTTQHLYRDDLKMY